MNIFVLSPSPQLSAQWQTDRHVVKMCLESMQLLYHGAQCFSIPVPKGAPALGKTHAKHPCAIWTGSAPENYRWLYNHASFLFLEYERRFVRIHRSSVYLPALAPNWQESAQAFPVPYSFAACMPPAYRVTPEIFQPADAAVESYYRYYSKAKLYPGAYRWAAQVPAIFREDLLQVEKSARQAFAKRYTTRTPLTAL